MKVVSRLVVNILSVIMACVLSVQITALLAALVSSLNSIEMTTKIIIGCSVVLSFIVTVLIWSGKMNLSTTKGVLTTSVVCNVYFIILIACTLVYMAVLGEIKYVMLGEVIVTWVIWFVFISTFSNIKKNLSESENKNPENAGAVVESK